LTAFENSVQELQTKTAKIKEVQFQKSFGMHEPLPFGRLHTFSFVPSESHEKKISTPVTGVANNTKFGPSSEKQCSLTSFISRENHRKLSFLSSMPGKRKTLLSIDQSVKSHLLYPP
jgi:hypothetical protein